MAVYDVKIETEDIEIVFDKAEKTENENREVIDSVTFKMNTINENTLNRGSGVRCELIIEGKINSHAKEETVKLAKWAMCNSNESQIYRKVSVIVYTNSGRDIILREYTIDKMFCIDYDEIFDSNGNSENGKFILHIAQKDGEGAKTIFAD